MPSFLDRMPFLCSVLLASQVWGASALQERLLSPDAAVRQAALPDVQKLDVREKRELLVGVEPSLQSDASMAVRAAQALGALGGYAEGAAPALVNALHYDEEDVAKAVSDALVKIGPACVPSVAKGAGDSNFIVRRRVAEILGRFGPGAAPASAVLVRMAEDPQFDVHSAAEAALVKVGNAAIPAMVNELRSADDQTKRSLVVLLGKMGPGAAAPLARILRKSDNAYVRASAADALGGLTSAPAVAAPALMAALNDLDDGVRGEAADGLGQMGNAAKSALGTLIVMSHADKDSLAQQKARDAVTRLLPASAVSMPGLIRNLSAPDSAIRQDVVKAMVGSDISPKDAAPLLLTAASDSDVAVRAQALAAAQSFGPKQPAAMIPVAQKLTSDSDETIRSGAGALLTKLQIAAPAATPAPAPARAPH